MTLLRNILVKGSARDHSELFEFTIEHFVSGGFMLSIKYSGDCHHNLTGAGVWPTIDKAKEIAAETARRLLHGATVTWDDCGTSTCD
jgi:DNA-directed RNA polymerase subunit L